MPIISANVGGTYFSNQIILGFPVGSSNPKTVPDGIGFMCTGINVVLGRYVFNVSQGYGELEVPFNLAHEALDLREPVLEE